MDKLQRAVRRAGGGTPRGGQEAIPFHKFADLIKTQVGVFKEKGSPEVAFRVAVKDGKVASPRGDEGDRQVGRSEEGLRGGEQPGQ